jgi:hypothetical protein
MAHECRGRRCKCNGSNDRDIGKLFPEIFLKVLQTLERERHCPRERCVNVVWVGRQVGKEIEKWMYGWMDV